MHGIHHHTEHHSKPGTSRSATMRFMDSLVYAGGVLGPLFTLPQLVKIWQLQSASGVSLISWGAYLLGSIFWIAYGTVHKAKPIVFCYSMWAIVEIFIIIGIIMFR